MDINGIEGFFGVKFEEMSGAVNPGDILECYFEKGPLKFQLLIIKSDSRLYINADPIKILGNAVPTLELNVQFDELEFEEYEGIEKGMMFLWKGVKQNLYITKLKDAYSISFSCDTPSN